MPPACSSDPSPEMELSLRPQHFRLAMLIQNIAYAAFMQYRANSKEKPHTIALLVKGHVGRLVKNAALGGTPFECDVVFDESIWPPGTDRHGKVMRVLLAPEPAPTFYIFEFDFRKPIREGISIVDDKGAYSVDVLNVKFTGELPEQE